MTANQIAYGANVETERHNRATEENAQRANDIEQFKADTDRAYKEKMADLERQYKEAYLEWSKAEGTRKLELEAEMNAIENFKAQATAMYYSEQSAHEGMRVEIASKQQSADEKYKQAMAALGYDKNAIDRYLAQVKNKQVEYQQYYNLESLELQSQQIAQQYDKMRQDWNTTILNQNFRYDDLSLKRQEFELQQQQFEFYKKTKPIEYGLKVGDQVSNMTSSLFKGLGFRLFDLGGVNGSQKTAKDLAWDLFK